MKKIILLFLFILGNTCFSQKAKLVINEKKAYDNYDSGTTKNGYIYTLKEERILKIYEPENFKLHKQYEFDFDVSIYYVSDNADFIRLKRQRTKTNKFFKALAGKKKKIHNYYNLINCEKLVGFNEEGNFKKIDKKLDLDGLIANGNFYTNTHEVSIYYKKIRNKKNNNKKYFILTTDLKTNKTTYKEFTIDDDLLLPVSRSYAYKYKLKRSNRKTTLYISDYNNNSFTLMTRSYDNYRKGKKEPSIQKTQLLKYNFNGELIMNNILENNIDPKMEYVDVNSHLFPVKSYDEHIHYHTSSTGQSYTTVTYTPNEVAMGYFHNPEDTEEYYSYSLLKGIKSKFGVKLLISKYNNKSNKVWSKEIVVSEKKPKFDTKGFRSKLDVSDYKNTLSISLSNNKDHFFRTYHINKTDGTISEPHNFSKVKYGKSIFTRRFSNKLKVKSISKKHNFSEQTLRYYFLNDKFKKHIDNLPLKKKYDFFTTEEKGNLFLNSTRKDEISIYKF